MTFCAWLTTSRDLCMPKYKQNLTQIRPCGREALAQKPRSEQRPSHPWEPYFNAQVLGS